MNLISNLIDFFSSTILKNREEIELSSFYVTMNLISNLIVLKKPFVMNICDKIVRNYMILTLYYKINLKKKKNH